mmetsp:Transcript_37745/g.95473  ORF Transcript_37745/g.95473 Transcript_37745/m.95473 type:complete len:243 (+) Transcript_37745:1732-2460(+)
MWSRPPPVDFAGLRLLPAAWLPAWPSRPPLRRLLVAWLLRLPPRDSSSCSSMLFISPTLLPLKLRRDTPLCDRLRSTDVPWPPGVAVPSSDGRACAISAISDTREGVKSCCASSCAICAIWGMCALPMAPGVPGVAFTGSLTLSACAPLLVRTASTGLEIVSTSWGASPRREDSDRRGAVGGMAGGTADGLASGPDGVSPAATSPGSRRLRRLGVPVAAALAPAGAAPPLAAAARAAAAAAC